MLEPRVVAGFAAMIGFTVGANLMLKLGAMDPSEARFLFGVVGWRSLAGLCLFGCAGLIYAILLRFVALNIAQVFTAAQFVGVVVAARLVMEEPISWPRWIGIAFICTGMLIVALTLRG